MADWPARFQRHILDEVDSTSDEARRNLAQGEGWYMAHRQTAARGRRGRPWHAPIGNFMASLVLHLNLPANQAAQYSFVAALALYDTLVALTGQETTFSLKWPNDVLARGRKLAGILLETSSSGRQVDHLIIGIGVNLAWAPGPDQVEEGALAPISLRQATGIDVAPEVFLDTLAAAFSYRETQLRDVGFQSIRTDWLARAANLGQPIIARMGEGQIEGVFESLDDTGALILRNASGTQTITAADIYF